MSRCGSGVVILLAAILCGPGTALADDSTEGEPLSEKRPRFGLGVGWAYADFSTTYERYAIGGSERIFVSLEGDLGLPATDNTPVLTFLARIGKRDYIAANWARSDRSETLLDIDDTVVLGDLVIEVQAEIDLFFNVDEIDVAYGHAYVDDDRVRIIGKYGLSLLDLDIGLAAEGNYSIGDVSGSGRYEVSSSLLVPVPLVGVLFDVELAPRWTLNSSVEFFYLPVGKTTAEAWRAALRVSYAFSHLVGVNFGYGSYDVKVIEEKDNIKSDIQYTMNGFSAGLRFTF